MPKHTSRLALLTAAAVTLATALAGPASAASSSNGAAWGGGNAQRGAVKTGVYPNLFREAGYSPQAIDAKLDAAWQQLFYGDPGTLGDPTTSADDYFDGQSIYYQVAPGLAYVTDVHNHDVRTEGMGYAMMIAVELGKKAEFDSLWNYAKTYMQFKPGTQEEYFFAWHTNIDGSPIAGSAVAPDGDQWMAAALEFAHGRWGDGTGIYDYGTEGYQIIHAMFHQSDHGGVNMFDPKSLLPLFTPPATFLAYSDASYALPAFYRVFAQADPADADLWNQTIAANERFLQVAHDPATGLAPCYSNFDGTPYLRAGQTIDTDAYNSSFQEDAWRVIANANVDAMWYGVQPWQTQYSNTLESFFAGQGISTYASRWHLDGTVVVKGQNTYEPTHAEGLVAMNSVSALTATNSDRLDFVRDLWNTDIPSGSARYYDGMLYILGLLYDSGNFRVW